MSAATYDTGSAFICLSLEGAAYPNNDDEDAPYIDLSPAITFFWNCANAIALAAAYQHGAIACRPASVRHHYRQRKIEDLRVALRHLLDWKEPVELLAIEAEVMHKEVARLRAALAYVAQGGSNAAEIAKRTLDEGKAGEPGFLEVLEQRERQAG